MLKRTCKCCYKEYQSTDSTANNEWGFCSKVCEKRYDVWEDKKSERIS